MLSDPDYDAYLSLLTRFLRLSPSQRDEIRRELRAHMEEAIEAQLERGVPRDEAVRRALEDFGDAAELAARFSSIGGRKRWIMKGTAAAACIGFVALAFNNLPTWNGDASPTAARTADTALQSVAAAVQPHQDTDDADRDRRIFEALNKRVPEVAFDSVELEPVFDWFSEVTGIRNCHVQWSRLEEAGIERGTPISMRISDLRAERILRFILTEASNDHVDLQYAVFDGILVISTPEGFQRNLHIEVYAVDDLPTHTRRSARDPLTGADVLTPRKTDVAVEDVAPAEPESDLINLIQNAVAPDTWSANGGSGYIQVYHGSLVVRQSEAVHAELARLLAALREPKKD